MASLLDMARTSGFLNVPPGTASSFHEETSLVEEQPVRIITATTNNRTQMDFDILIVFSSPDQLIE
jgi:hypothetical protein